MSEKTIPLVVTGLIIALSAVSVTSVIFALDASKAAGALAQRVAALEAGHRNSYGKLGELDAGMFAMAKMLKLDGKELGRLMAVELSSIRADAKGAKNLGAPVDVAAAYSEPANSPAAIVAPVAAIQAETVAPIEAPAAPIETHVVADGAGMADRTPDGVLSEGEWNPFDALVAEASAENGETAAPATAAAEPSALAVSKAAQMTMAKVDSLLVARISDSWVRPAGDIKDLRTEILVKMNPDGTVKSVDVTKGSGDKDFDFSAVKALENIGQIDEIKLLDDATYTKGYKSRSIVFSPEMIGG